MLDVKFIRDNQELVKKAIRDKGIGLNLDELLGADQERRKLTAEIDELRNQRNEISEKMAAADSATKKRLLARGKKLKEQLSKLEKRFDEVVGQYNELKFLVPNIPAADWPVGGEEDFEVVEERGQIPSFGFPVRDHIKLGQALDILDLERGVKTAGYRGYYLKNEGALLHWGVLSLALQRIVKAGFTPMIPPTLVREFALIGSGHFPADRQEIYQLEEYSPEKEKELKFLTGTAEPSLLAYRADEILEARELPLKLCGVSPCYRREVGGYGKDTRGIYRIHEFWKVEQVVLCENDLQESEKWFEAMRQIAQDLLDDLDLPHRVVKVTTRDMGAGKYKMYDIETWMPSRNGYGETHSCSNLTDWQARRLNIRYKTNQGLKFVHTLNNTVIASPRILIAILENNQQKDGSVKIPKKLRDFMGKKKLEPK